MGGERGNRGAKEQRAYRRALRRRPLDHPPLSDPLTTPRRVRSSRAFLLDGGGCTGRIRPRTRGVGSPCDLTRRRGAPASGRRVAVASGESGARRWLAVPVPGASWRGRWSGCRVHCCGTAKYMDAARSGVRAGQRAGQSALPPVRTARRAPAGGSRRRPGSLSVGTRSGRAGRATGGCPMVIPMPPPRVHPTPSHLTRSFPLVRPLALTSPGMPTTPLPSTLLGRTWGKGTVRRRRAAGCEGSSADFCLRRALAGRLAAAGCVGRGREPGRAVGGSGDHGQPPQHDRRQGGVR